VTTTKSPEEKSTRAPSRRGTLWLIVLVPWIATHLLLFWSLLRWQTVTTVDATSHIPMGLPFPFLYQDQSWHHSGEVPIRTRFLAPQEFVTHMIWPNYLLDLVLVWGTLLLITGLILWVVRKVRRA